MRRSTLFLATLCVALVATHCGDTPPPPTGERSAALTASAEPTPRPCTRPQLPGTDPNKPLATHCAAAALTPKDQAVIAAQQAYLSEWRQQAPTWTGLSAHEKEVRRRALKAKHLGGQP